MQDKVHVVEETVSKLPSEVAKVCESIKAENSFFCPQELRRLNNVVEKAISVIVALRSEAREILRTIAQDKKGC